MNLPDRLRLRPLDGMIAVGRIHRETAESHGPEPTGGTVVLSDDRRLGPMLLVKGLGEDGRARIRMSAQARKPFEYSADGRRWEALEGDEDAAFRVFGLLDPRQVLHNLGVLEQREATWEHPGFKVAHGDEHVIATLELDRWSPALPDDYLRFLEATAVHPIGIGVADGRVVELVQRDVFPRQDDIIRVVFSYRPGTIRSFVRWAMDGALRIARRRSFG